jgi:nucleoside 2-deoxyribosyltransferase
VGIVSSASSAPVTDAVAVISAAAPSAARSGPAQTAASKLDPIQVYVASPLGFTESGRLYWHEVLEPALRGAGVDPLDPWDAASAASFAAAELLGEPERTARLAEVNERVGRRNAELLERCEGVLAVLDGADVDSGTAAEIGYAGALGKPVVGLRTDLRPGGDNAATPVNLQVAYFISASGGRVCTDVGAAVALVVELTGPPGP